jgi:hypothetical protein
VEAAADDDQLADRHLVEGERARLVRADGRRRAQGLDRAEALDDGALGGQRLGADRQQHRHHRREAGGKGGDGQRDAHEEQVVEVLAPDQAQDHDQDEGQGGHDRDDHGDLVELLGERRLLLLDPAEHSGDVATSLPMPVAVTTISPRPRVTCEFM